MQDLQALIDWVTRGTGIHISIMDLSGVLSTPSTRISFRNMIHSKSFCRIAKSTPCGYHACVRCKKTANKKAAAQGSSFLGYCYFGLYEAAFPVVIDGKVTAVVYVGHAIVDEEKTRKRMQIACRLTGVDQNALLAEAQYCERLESGDMLLGAAEIIGDYLKMLYEKAPKKDTFDHWLVTALKRHADQEYDTPLTLRQLAAIYHKNEKYMGRLFKKEVGVSFQEYCLSKRLQRAEALLRSNADKIIEVAMESGFNNVSYFNRMFFKRNGITPRQYRDRMRKS